MQYIQKNTNKIFLTIGIIVLGIFFQINGFDALNDQTLQNQLQDFFILFMSLIVEATPFVFIGVVVSVIVAIFFSDDFLLRLLPKNNILARLVLSFTGIFMPVCECGNVPVVRRLLLKGFNVSHGVTFLLAAPIINPVTVWATLEAFDYDYSVVLLRLGGALFIANFVGWFIGLYKNSNEFLTDEFYKEVCDHDHSHDDENKLRKAISIFEDEFLSVMKMLILGAAIASLFQVFVPREWILELGSDPFLSILAMILFAFVISICANVDAFYAITFANQFTFGSIVAFLVFGPMVDIKMLAMLKNTFDWKFLSIMTYLVTILTIIIGLLVNYLY